MYQIIAVIIILMFYIMYYSKQFMLKRKGIKTNQLKNQTSGKNIASIMGLSNLIVAIVEFASIYFNKTSSPSFIVIIGIIVGLAGNFIFLAAITKMGNNWRAGVNADEDTELVTDGIYSISRNPAFVGFDLVYLGVFLMFSNWWLFITTIFAIIMLHIQIVKIEEPYLNTAFGQSYQNYCQTVKRYIGRKYVK